MLSLRPLSLAAAARLFGSAQIVPEHPERCGHVGDLIAATARHLGLQVAAGDLLHGASQRCQSRHQVASDVKPGDGNAGDHAGNGDHGKPKLAAADRCIDGLRACVELHARRLDDRPDHIAELLGAGPTFGRCGVGGLDGRELGSTHGENAVVAGTEGNQPG